MSNKENLGIYTIDELFKEKNKLKIPVYQRPYLWNEEQVKYLLKDFLEIFENKNKDYLIGNMIFYKNKDNLEIVDGQQRAITLALLLYNLKDTQDLKDTQTKAFLKKINISNPLSKKAIYDNNQIIKNYIDRFLSDEIIKKEFLEFIKNNIFITYIIAKTQDEAFIFFDSQNTRGKSLDRQDLLKAHHLRDTNLDSNKRVIYAKIWENYDEKELKRLLEIHLTLSRNFVKGNYKFDIDVYDEFKSNSFGSRLNNYNQPPLFKSADYDTQSKKLKLKLKDNVEFKIGNSLILDDAEKYLPFEVLQSIGGGEEFFWYISKYISLKNSFEELLDTKIINLVNSLSLYLQDYFYAITFLYFDKFGDDKFEEFCNLILWLISHYRLDNYAVKYLGVRNFIRDHNIFIKLFFSYSSDEIIEKIRLIIKYKLNIIYIEKAGFKGMRADYCEKIKDNENLNKIAKLVKDKCVKQD